MLIVRQFASTIPRPYRVLRPSGPLSTLSTHARNSLSAMSAATAPPPRRDRFVEGNEIRLLETIFSRPDRAELEGNPQRVLAAVDEFVKTQHLMIIGAQKGALITKLIAERKPSTMIELGGYVGYSAILFGDAVRKAGGKQYLSLEIDVRMAAVANMLVSLAGLRDFVKILVAPSHESLIRLFKTEKTLPHVELLFLDHWKDRYVPDLLLLEELNVLKPGVSVLAADNVISPGAPDYLEWVRATPEQKKALVEKRKKQFAQEESNNEALNTKSHGIDLDHLLGNPRLVYESSITEFEVRPGRKDGVEISRVVREEPGA